MLKIIEIGQVARLDLLRKRLWRHYVAKATPMSIKHCLVQLWQPFPYIFVDADVVNAQCAKWGSTLPKTSSRATLNRSC